MTPESIKAAEAEAKRFLATVKAWRAVATIEGRSGFEFASYHPRESDAWRRASLDLTRALASMRRPG
jgi:hypothetical protein